MRPARRRASALLLGGAATAGLRGILRARAAPAAVVRDRARPAVAQGIQIGDVTGDRAMVWSRADRPARMVVEVAATEQFRAPRVLRGPHALEPTDFTARLDLTGLPPGQEVHLRVTFEALDGGARPVTSEPVVGRFRGAPRGRRDVAFLWSAETAGQGFGINPAWGGMRIYETMRRERPDFFLHCGDTIYADKPISSEVALPDGTMWRNLTTAAKSKVAETLDDFRGNYLYNLLDDNLRRFAAEVPQVWQWDDHEVLDNWWPGRDLSGDPRYREKSVALLAARAGRAFREYAPMRWHTQDEPERLYRRLSYGPHLDLFVVDLRSYRAPNSHNQQATEGPETALLAPAQWDWLAQGITTSRATWKVIAAGLPIGLLVGDGRDAEGRPRQEAIANGPGAPMGRELELARLLRALARKRIRNLVWLCGDVHYTAAHHYHPSRARLRDFLPFWEFVSGPLNAGTFGPNPLDDTFGPEVVFQKVPARGGAAPSAGLQFFGRVDIDGASGEMKVSLKDVAGETLFVQRLRPASR